MSRKNTKLFLLAGFLLLAGLEPLFGMHIMEGFLPATWCGIWYIITLPVVVISYRYILKITKENPKMKILLALSAAFVFILSALKLPSVTGSSSHLTGTTLGTVLIGAWAMPVIGVIVLLFQALLLAHGGISTLGANVFSLSIVGPFVAYGIIKGLQKTNLNKSVIYFIATFFGTLSTYLTTSFQLAFVFPDPTAGIWGAAVKFMSIFAVTQVPLAIVEGIITVLVLRILTEQKVDTVMFQPKKSTK
ncbi:Energy-coupling factor transporter probable substrate-capture protein CbiM [Porphyromonas macacae]|uniref:Cobalt transport protein CbiM n=1 Tax=Porphyromonas macacae TaxID=28115 RepID=A0A379E8L8_9PORP|nr:energy-coupling factor ABC transporter permease [Porphyromonas macacae]SUB89025.1 Energy-coupling factor transporter probable substrate-capture protein CbiM [Porphyromonas macacae]